MKIPDILPLANTPTPIHAYEAINPEPGWASLYIKRDDFTGFEAGGNKIRKLEFHFHRAMEQGASVIITCGGLQSNHARATASTVARLGLKCHLLLRGPDAPRDGNYLFDLLFGADITLVTQAQYKNSRSEMMSELGEGYRQQGFIPYIIPEGGSDGLGVFGYYKAYQEILAQEQELGIRFDAICHADGSGGTYAGLYAANEYLRGGKHIIGFNVSGPEGARDTILRALEEWAETAMLPHPVSDANIIQSFDYTGDGYGVVNPELVDFIRQTARVTGIITDPVYTGKALLGTVSEIAKRNPLLRGNVLFIHTGGHFGFFPYKELFHSSDIISSC